MCCGPGGAPERVSPTPTVGLRYRRHVFSKKRNFFVTVIYRHSSGTDEHPQSRASSGPTRTSSTTAISARRRRWRNSRARSGNSWRHPTRSPGAHRRSATSRTSSPTAWARSQARFRTSARRSRRPRWVRRRSPTRPTSRPPTPKKCCHGRSDRSVGRAGRRADHGRRRRQRGTGGEDRRDPAAARGVGPRGGRVSPRDDPARGRQSGLTAGYTRMAISSSKLSVSLVSNPTDW